jgi:alkylation response protein AidB-like acyl-CoA dehydrogenase
MTREAYRFDGYLEALGDDWLADDPLLQRWLARAGLDGAGVALVERFGRAAATSLRASADRVERREALPRLDDPGPLNERARRLVVPEETLANLGALHGSGIWRAATDERARYAVVYLINQNGEAGVACSAACTDGLARVLRALGGDARSRAVVDRLERATPADWVHGAQFVTEIQGGSDAATNALRAVPARDGLYALHGPKWFCSNATADYWLVTARADGSAPGHRGVSLFCVPREQDGAPNGHAFVRLKDKLGTRALPTAEIEFEGALGWPVGALDAGLRNMVAIVLTTSRIHCILAAAASSRRAAREAAAYTGFREAFGRKLVDHPLVGASLRRIREGADLAEAGAFAAVDAWLAATTPGAGDDARLWARVLVSLAKAVSARAATARVYEAMMLLGGNGIEERFNALPRLWRDAAIIESWEGPYTLLLMQALEDLARYRVAGREEAFLRHGLGEHFEGALAAELARILAEPEAPDAILAFGELAPRLHARFEARALAELRASR